MAGKRPSLAVSDQDRKRDTFTTEKWLRTGQQPHGERTVFVESLPTRAGMGRMSIVPGGSAARK
jgi:hypothetical protein